MFHVMLVLPLLAAFGVLGVILVFAPLCAGVFLQILFSVFARSRWVLFVPAGLGAVGLVLSAVYLTEMVSMGAILVYWGIFFLFLWVTWLAVDQIRKFFSRKREAR